MIDNWELWAVAAKVLELHGENVGDFLDERIRVMAAAGDEAGLAHWLAIVDRVDQLSEPAYGAKLH
jgi:hypothetical protein